MVLVVDLLVSAHEVDCSSVSENSRVAVIPLTVKLNKIPVMVASCNGISLDHHVGYAGLIEQHLAACIVDIAVTASSGKSL